MVSGSLPYNNKLPLNISIIASLVFSNKLPDFTIKMLFSVLVKVGKSI